MSLPTFRRLLPAVILFALTLLFFYKLAFTDLILARGDTYAYFYPYWAVRNAALLRGELPLWTPNLFMGVPLLANSQLGTFYPPNWLVIGLAPPDGIRISILMHVFCALLGTYALARERVRTLAALSAAVVFGFGGYVGAHVEQINQLQGISWMPWLFLLYGRALAGSRLSVLLMGAALALQFLSGHTQTVFITAVGLGVYGLVQVVLERRLLRSIASAMLILVGSAVIALVLVTPQLIPTLELMSVSNRSGGLNPNQATAFSFNPLVMGRGLLPSYDSLVFGEYVAYGGVIGSGLAIVGALIRRRTVLSPSRFIWVTVMLVGLALAFGEFNPLYWTLAGLPGFNLFRVPARWLALFSLGLAMLAGLGVQALSNLERPQLRVLALITLIVSGLATSSTLITRTPEDVIGSAAPTLITWIGWGAALITLLALLTIRRANLVLTVALVVELFFASGVLPYNMLSTPDTYQAQRFSISQMLAYGDQQTPPGRVLSISDLLFDPGDRATLEARYRHYGLSDLSIRLGLVGTKMKEALAANLPLIWGIPTIDGFDGGVLPTLYYTAFTSLMLPPGELRTIDGRLREILAREDCRGACIPDQRWLNLTNTRYLLTDKVYDVVQEGVFYDTQLSSGSTRIDVNPFEATTLHALISCADNSCACPTVEGDVFMEAVEQGTAGDFQLCRLEFDQPAEISQINVTVQRDITVHALTLVDTRTGDFSQVVPDPNWRRVLSSDIKLYENQTVLPRAFVVHEALAVADDIYGTEDALNLMRAPEFNPARTVILSVNETQNSVTFPEQSGTATISHYSAEHVDIQVSTEAESYLVLTDAYYPGWMARINDQPVEILRANVMFRAVRVPAGENHVSFIYEPLWLPAALIVGAAAWILLIAVILFLSRKRSHQSLI